MAEPQGPRAGQGGRQLLGRWGILYALFGLFLPIVALACELWLRASDTIYFDPIPTWFHVVLIAAVPLVNAYAIFIYETERAAHARRALAATAFTLAISCVYALLYLPILPLSSIAILFYGIGLLPYAPLFAALATWRLHRRLRLHFPQAIAPARSGWVAAAGLACLLVFEAPGWVAQTGFWLADSTEPEEERRGLTLLRSWASDTAMRRVVHYGIGRANLTGHMIFGDGFLRAFSASGFDRENDARIYYRATGVSALDTEPPARPASDRRFLGEGRRDLTRVQQDLVLTSSRLDGTVHPEADLAYLEWTLVLRNDQRFDQEGRAHVLLPPDAAVTRATLWVNGEPRDAAFGPRKKVTQAYERVTARRKDPLLVNAAGRDRVSIRCFPVPAKGTMKIRLGITSPLLIDEASGALRLPKLLSPNFRVDPNLVRDVWIDSPVVFTSVPDGLAVIPEPGKSALRGTLPENAPGWLELARSAPALTWAADAVSPNGVAIAQSFEAAEHRIDRVVAVVDGSASMAEHAGAIADALAELPTRIELGVFVAGDETVELLAPGAPREAALYLLRSFDYVGGQDSIPALMQAFDRAAAVPRSAVLWIHAPVPLTLSNSLGLQTRFERRPDGPRWLDLQTEPGADALVASLLGAAPVEPVPRRGTLGDDLEAALERLAQTRPTFVAVRERLEPPSGVGVAPPDSAQSAHLSRLWARDHVLALLRVGGSGAHAEAAALATRYRVVTPVSGAVVLETDLQYTQNDLSAPKEGVDELLAATDSPFASIGGPLDAVPEPGTGALTVLGITMLAAWRRRRRLRH